MTRNRLNTNKYIDKVVQNLFSLQVIYEYETKKLNSLFINYA